MRVRPRPSNERNAEGETCKKAAAQRLLYRRGHEEMHLMMSAEYGGENIRMTLSEHNSGREQQQNKCVRCKYHM